MNDAFGNWIWGAEALKISLIVDFVCATPMKKNTPKGCVKFCKNEQLTDLENNNSSGRFQHRMTRSNHGFVLDKNEFS